jgi:hypothetical protein
MRRELEMGSKGIVKTSLVLAILVVISLFVYNLRGYGESNPTSAEFTAAAQKALDEAYQKGNLDALDEIYAADIVIHNLFPQDTGIDGFKAVISRVRNSYSECRLVLDGGFIGEGMGATRSTLQCKGYKGPTRTRWVFQDKNTEKVQTVTLQRYPDRDFISKGCAIVRMESGKIVEMWAYQNVFASTLEHANMILREEAVGD